MEMSTICSSWMTSAYVIENMSQIAINGSEKYKKVIELKMSPK